MRLATGITALFIFQSVFAQRFALQNVAGKQVYVDVKKQNAIYVFLSPECPLCQNYTKTLNELFGNVASRGIQVLGVIPGNDYTKSQLSGFVQSYRVKFPIYIDSQKKLTRHFRATITPEVFFYTINKGLIYSGRIDNWAYAPGRKRSVITEHNLQDAVEQYLAGKSVKVSKTKAVGCFIE
jgi:peroxiredoxin